ncbi:reverse transcriptase domain-containing protein [Tanacetum coccineum]
MVDQRTMAELLRAPTEGYAEAIVVPPIPAEPFELKHNLINLVTSKQFFGFKKEDPHAHIRAVTSAMTAMFKQHQVTLAPASVKAVEESCVTYGGALSYRQCPAIDGNTFSANQIRPPGFAQPNVQNNQTRYNQGYNQNRGINQGNPNYQAPAYQAPIHQPQVVTTSDFSNYIKANDAVMKNMQTQMTSLTNSNIKLKNMFGQFMKMNTASTLGSSSLLSNTVANPRGDLKAITTRSGISYDGPPIPPPSSSLPKVVEREPEVTKDTMLLSTENIQPLVVQIQAPIDEPVLVKCLALADLGASINLMPLSMWKKLSLPELTPTQMILELAARSTTSPSVDDEAITFKVGQTLRYSYNDAMSINRIDVIDVACEEYAQEVLGFSDSSTSGNPTPSLDHILSTSSPSLTPFEEEDFILEEIEVCLTNDSIPPGIDNDDFDPEGDLLLLETLLNDDTSSPLPPKELHVEKLEIVKSSIGDPPELELKDLPSHLEYAFLEGTDKLPVIIAKELKEDEKVRLLKVLKSHKHAISWKISDIKGIDPQFYTYNILMEDDSKPEIQHQRRVNLKIHKVIKKEVIKLLDVGLIYPISDSPWLNDATRKDHFPLPFMDQMLERLAGNEYYCFLDGFSRYFQIPIDPKNQEKTTFTCPYGTFSYRRMPFGLCNAPGTFQRCMMAIFHDMIEETMEVFMDDFSIFRDSFSLCLSYLDKMLKRCEDTNLVLNWEKCHFMVKEGIVLGHEISKSRIEVDKAKVDVIAKLPHPTSVKGI